MSATQWSIVLAKIDLVSLSFRLLWYHSILKGSIDQYNSLWLVLVGFHDFHIFPDRTSHAWSVAVRSQSLSSELAVKCPHVGRRKIQSSLSRENTIGLVPYPRANKDRSNPHPMTCLPHPPPPLHPTPRRLYIDKCISGIRIPCVVSRIPKPMIQESASKNFTDSGIQMPLHGAKGYMSCHELPRNKLFRCLTKHYKSSWWHLWSLVTLGKIFVGEKDRLH